MVDHCNTDHILDRNNVESILHNAFGKALPLEFSLRKFSSLIRYRFGPMRERAPKIILKTSLIHDAVSAMLVCHRQPNQIYIHEHGKKAETIQVKIFVVRSYEIPVSPILLIKNYEIEKPFETVWNCETHSCTALMGSPLSGVTGDSIFNLDLVLFCDLIIKLKFTSTNNLFHVFSLFEI